MIYTLTLNPSIDYFIHVDDLLIENEVNRSSSENMKAGGKGLNVSMMLHQYDIPSNAIALLGGITGEWIKQDLNAYSNITLKEITTQEMTRINVKISSIDKNVNVNGKGAIGNEEIKRQIIEALNELNESDWVFISGSSIQNIDKDFIVELANLIHDKDAKLVMDMESLSIELLEKCKPYLIKPNLHELRIILNNSELDVNHMYDAIRNVLDTGTKSILLSLGKDGALYVNEKECYRVEQDSITAINTVGSGDAMLATFVGMMEKEHNTEEALKWATAAGIAMASTRSGITEASVKEQLKKVRLKKV